MHFLAPVYVKCEVCNGKRYNKETLAVKFKSKNISDILSMTVDDACEFFESNPQVYSKLKTLQNVGLGYISIGQAATTLSGGEAQRIKLSKELSKRQTGKTLYILDEPTTGLHFDDIKKLLEILHKLVSYGNTVIVIEHNLDVINTSDWVIDLGPEGGDQGGSILFEGLTKDSNNIGLGVNAGHDLNLENINFFVKEIPFLDEVSIGHAIICESLYLGLENVINMYLQKINNAIKQ